MGDSSGEITPVEPSADGPELPPVGARSKGACRVNGQVFVWEHTWETEWEGRMTLAAEESTLRLRVMVGRNKFASRRTIAGTTDRFELVAVFYCVFDVLVVIEPGEGFFPSPVAKGDRLILRPRVAMMPTADVTPKAVQRMLQWCGSRGTWGRHWLDWSGKKSQVGKSRK